MGGDDHFDKVQTIWPQEFLEFVAFISLNTHTSFKGPLYFYYSPTVISLIKYRFCLQWMFKQNVTLHSSVYLTLSLRMDPVTSSSLRCRLNFGGMLSSGCSSRSGSLCRTGREEGHQLGSAALWESFNTVNQTPALSHYGPAAFVCYIWRPPA